jgi:hypothetical protein
MYWRPLVVSIARCYNSGSGNGRIPNRGQCNREFENHCVIAICSAAAALDPGISRQRKIDIVRGSAVDFSRSGAD